MAAKFNLEIKVGIFAFIALIILTLAVFSISEIHIFGTGYNIAVSFSFASGIDVGAPVRIAGVEAGEVKAVELGYDEKLNKARIIVSVWLNKGVNLPRDSYAYVSILGLIGETYMEIIPGKDYVHLMREGDLLIGHDPISSETMMETFNRAAVNLNRLLVSLNEVFDEQTKAGIKQSVQNIKDASGSVDDVLDKETKASLKTTIHNFRDLTENIKIITGRLERGEGKLGAWLKPKKTRRTSD